MEEHRLKPMREGYSQESFNKLYKQTEGLRRKLAGEIQSSRFGVDYEEILSWFDVKFIHVFNKYFDRFNEDTLLGHLINSLKTYKYRILRTAYNKKNQIHQQTVDIDEITDYENLSTDKDEALQKDLHLAQALGFLKNRLSKDAFDLLNLELAPPPYILSRLPEKTKKIPNELIIGFFDIEEDKSNYIDSLRTQISRGVREARYHFAHSS